MKTIEEKVKEYADLCVVGDCSGLSGLIHSVAEKAYFAGCHEQKVIDDDHLREVKKMVVEKACKWWNKEMREVNYGTYNEAIKAFRKAMEE